MIINKLFITSSFLLALGWAFLVFTQDYKSVYWVPAHLSLLTGTLFIISSPIFFKKFLQEKVNRRLLQILLFTTSIGVILLAVEFIIDLAVWFSSSSAAQMQMSFDQLQKNPVTRIPFYTAGPALFFIGLLSYAVALISTRRDQTLPAILIIIAVSGVVFAHLTNAPALFSLISYLVLSAAFALLEKSQK